CQELMKVRKANTTDLGRPSASEAVFSCPNTQAAPAQARLLPAAKRQGEGGCMSGEVLQNAAGEMTVEAPSAPEALPAEEDARAALEAARSELETLRSELERFRAGEQARMAADEEARRRAEVE